MNRILIYECNEKKKKKKKKKKNRERELKKNIYVFLISSRRYPHFFIFMTTVYVAPREKRN